MRSFGFVSTRAHAALLGARAYVYGFPAVLMDRSRALFAQSGQQSTNALVHLHVVPDHTFRAVVRPNQDTLYSSAFLDLRRGPVALDLPEVAERRFVSFTLLDAWSNAFASVGCRSTRAEARGGNAARTYVIAGPDAPRDLEAGDGEIVRAPTNTVWTIGRIELFSKDDVPRVREIQSGVALRSLGDRAAAVPAVATGAVDPGTDPAAQVRAMPALEYFAALSRLLAEQPPRGDASILSAVARAGIRPGALEASALPVHVREGLVDGHRLGQRSIALALATLSARPGWGPGARVPLGDYGTQYLVRAVVAHVGFGANRRDEAVYMNAARDDWARLLDGSRRAYVLRFEPGGLPPVRAFWSVSLYGADGFFVASAGGRHVLGSHDALPRAPDGSLEIHVQHEAPDDARNWLPAPSGRFELTLRMYWPEPELVDGRWRPPRILSRSR